MKIAYDQQIFRLQTYGGVSRYFCEIASRIARSPSVQVSITAPMHINAYLDQVPAGVLSGFRAPRIERYQSDALRLAFKAAGIALSEIMLRSKSPDILHETYFSARRPGPGRARRVLTLYDMIHEKFPGNFHPLDKTARNKAIAAQRADHVICISESTQRDAIEILGLPGHKTSVIHLGFDLMRGAAAVGPPSEAQPPYLLYVGLRGGHKNFSGLLKAYAASALLRKDYALVCFGGGPFEAHERALISELGLSGHVRQTAGDDALLAELYQGARAFVYPSLYEGFGIPPLEAMAHGCPVICSNTSSIPEVVGDAGDYFEPTDTESMRTAIEHVLGSESRRETLIECGFRRLEAFSWDRCAAQTFDVYKTLM